MSMDDPTRRHAEQDDIDEQELKRRYHERLSDWSEPDAVKVYRNGKLLRMDQDEDEDTPASD